MVGERVVAFLLQLPIGTPLSNIFPEANGAIIRIITCFILNYWWRTSDVVE